MLSPPTLLEHQTLQAPFTGFGDNYKQSSTHHVMAVDEFSM
jgi:hypothetical protein